MKKIYRTGFLKATFFALFIFFFAGKSFADYTIAAGQTVDASTITGQSGVLTINGTLNLSSNVSLLGFTNVVINCPGKIYWTNNSDIIFGPGTSFDIIGYTTGSGCGLQPEGLNASMRLYIGSIIIAVSNDKSQNAAYSFADFNAAGGFAQFTLSTSMTSSCYADNPTFSVTLIPTDNLITYDYRWNINQGTISPIGKQTGATSAVTATVTPLSSSTVQTYKITAAIWRSGDGDTLAKKTITVTINPVIGNNTVAAAQSICNSSIPAPLTGSTPTGGNGAYTYLWESSTTSGTTGFSAASGTNSGQNYTPGLLTQTTWYRRTVTSGGCTDVSAAMQVTVNPVIGNNTVAAAQSICNSSTPAPLTGSTPTGGNGTYTYLWESSTTSGTTGFSAASGTNSGQNYTPGVLTQTTWYRRTVTSGGCTNIATAIQVTVNPVIGNNTVTAAQSICNSSTPVPLTGSTPTGGNGTYTYLWESSTTSGTTGFSAASGTNSGQGYTPGVLTQTTWYRRTVTSGGCTDVSTAIQITVNPVLGNNTIAAAQIICNSSIPAPLTGSTPTGGNGTYTYLWESSTTSGTTGFSAASGTNSGQNYTPGVLTQTTWYRRTVTSGGCTNIATAIQVTVNPVVSNNNVTAAQSICNSSTPAPLTGSTPTGGNGAYTYLWESSTMSATTGFTAASGTNSGQNYTPGVLTQTTWYRRTVTSGGCTDVSTAIQITVVAAVNFGTVASGDETICEGGDPSNIILSTLPTGGAGTFTYQWYYRSGIVACPTGTGTSGWTVIPGATGSSYNPPAGLATSTTYAVLVDATGGPDCGVATWASNCRQVTVNPIPSASSISISNSCFGNAASINVTATGASSYQWQISADGGSSWSDLSNTSPYSGVTGPSLGISSTAINLLSYYFRVQLSNSSCNAIASGAIPFRFLNQWTGATDQNWNNAANWSYGQTPSSNSCNFVIIPSGTINSPKLVTDAAVPDLIIANGANLDLNGHTLTLNGSFNGPGTTGTLSGSATSGLIVNGNAGTIRFNPSGPYNQLKTLTVNTNGSLTLGGNVTAGDTLNIAAGNSGSGYGTVIVNGNLNANGILTLKSDVNGTAEVGYSAGTITGNVTVERYIPPIRGWRFLSAPVNAGSQTVWDAWQEGVNNYGIDYNIFNKNPHPGYGTHITGNNNSSLGYDFNTTQNASYKVWNAAGTAWNTAQPPTKSTKVTDFSAYCIFVRGSRAVNLSLGTSAPPDATVLRTTGTLNQTGLTTTKSYTVTAPGKFVFLGNPYASAIDLHNVLQQRSSGIDTTKFWVWDPKIVGAGTDNVGAYVSYSNGMIVPSSSPSFPDVASVFRIQSGQAFMLQLSPASTTATLNFQESDKILQQANVFGLKAAKKSTSAGYPVIYTNLLLSKGDKAALIDGVGSGLSKRFSSVVDKDDAGKLWNFDENIALTRDNKSLAIEMRQPVTGTDTLFYDLLLKQKRYALQIFTANLAPDSSPKAWLIDKYLNKKIMVNLLDTTIYKFEPNSDSNSYRNRFMLVFRNIKENGAAPRNNTADMALIKAEDNVVLYPNPVVTGNTTLQFAHMDKGNYEVTVYSPVGQKLASRNIQHNGGSNNYVLPLEASWAPGIYRISIIHKDSGKARNLNLVINR